MNNTRKVLLVGSGMVTAPFIEYILKDKRNHITVASNESSLLNSTLKRFAGQNIEGILLDVVKEENKLETLVKEHFLIASFVPPFLHPVVAKACLKIGRNMITSSYVSDYLREIESQVKDKNLIFMNEIGLDPGLDHIITHKVLYEEERKGNKIIAYESWCGALPAPEVCNNPFSYKFSWSPKGALVAMNNKSHQLVNGKVVTFEPEQTIINTVDKTFHQSFNFEGYFNRDSRPYRDMYHLKHATTIIRGTLRYKGSTFAITCLKNVGLYNDDKLNNKFSNWRQLFNEYLKSEEKIQGKDTILFSDINHYDRTINMLYNENKTLSQEDATFYYSLARHAVSKFDLNYIKSNGGFDLLVEKAIKIFQFLEFHDSENKVSILSIKYILISVIKS